MKAGIEAASEHPDGAVEARGDIGGRDAEAAGGLGGGEVPAVAQFADVPVGGGQRGDHYAEQQEKLALLGPRRGVQGGIVEGGAGLVAGRSAFAAQIQRAIVDDGADPGAGRGTAAVFADMLQDPHPAFLEDVLGEVVVAGEAPGQGKKSPRAAGGPGFPVALILEKRAGAGGARAEDGRMRNSSAMPPNSIVPAGPQGVRPRIVRKPLYVFIVGSDALEFESTSGLFGSVSFPAPERALPGFVGRMPLFVGVN